MPRTFVWHPSKGPKTDTEAEPSRNREAYASSRSGAASGTRGACAGRSRRSVSVTIRTSW